MQLTESMPFKAGAIQAEIYGGPFKNFVKGTRRLVGVKMAEEIQRPFDIDIPTKDFDVPDSAVMEYGMFFALQAMAQGKDIYAGCMGGTGGTGTFMGCMAKLMIDYDRAEFGELDPVKYVRKHYRSHAIETAEQENFVRTFDTARLKFELVKLQPTHTDEVARLEKRLSDLDMLNGLLKNDVAKADDANMATLEAYKDLVGKYQSLTTRVYEFRKSPLMHRLKMAWKSAI